MPAYSNDIRCTLSISGTSTTLHVVSVSGTEALSSLYLFRCVLYSEQDVEVLPGQECTLSFRDLNDREHVRHGVVGSWTGLGKTPTGVLHELELHPHAWWLTHTEYSQVFLDGDQSDSNPGTPLKDILARAAVQGGLPARNLDFGRMQASFRRRYVCQYEESFFRFCARWLEFLGTAFHFVQDSGTDVLTVDEKAESGVLAQAIPYSEAFGLEARREGHIHALSCKRNIPPVQVVMRDYNAEHPDENVLAVVACDPEGIGESYFYGDHLKNTDEARQIGTLRSEEYLCRKRVLEGQGTVPDFRPGLVFTVQDHPEDECNGTFRVESVRHEISQSALLARLLKADLGAHAGSGEAVYKNSFVCLEAARQYRPQRRTPWPHIAKVISAHVENQGSKEYAQLDAQGRYHVRLPFDIGNAPEGRASCLLHMGKPYAGNGSGMHFPLPPGTEVMIGFVGGHPDRPYIAAAVPNPVTPSPRTEATQTSLVVTTLKRNVIEIEDNRGSEHLQMASSPTGAMVQYGNVPTGSTDCGGQGIYENTGPGGCHVLSAGSHAEENTVNRHREDVLGGNSILVIDGNRNEFVQGDFTETVSSCVSHTVSQNDYTECLSDRTLSLGAKCSVTTETGYFSETNGGNRQTTLAENFSANACTFLTLETAGKAIFNQKELAATSPKVTLTAGISLVKTTQAMVLNGPNATWDINACALNMDICDLNYSEKASDKDLYHLLDMSVNAVSTTNDALSYAYNALRKSLTTNKEDSDLFKLELSATKAKTTADECLNAAFVLRVTGLYNRT